MQRSRLQPQDRGGEHPEGAVAVGALVVASGEAAKLFAAVDQALYPIAQAVGGAVERPSPGLGAEPRNGGANAAATAVGPVAAPCVRFVADDPLGAHPRAAAARPLDGPLLQQLREDGGFVLLARGEHERE